ncbi:MAG: class I SAM-dependent methyltransferase [Candidatus Heimdallarchaeota archaeon]|nr:class I SAM-dependent methyltransferase [Candidatus Heimdallarchaeota archaeon]
MKNENINSFDWAVSFYDYTRAIPVDLLYSTIETIESQLSLDSRARILEIGVGTGRLAIPLQKITSSSFIGIDISEKMIQYCCKKALNDKSLSLIVADGSFLPFSIKFNTIITSHLLHLVSNPYTLLNKILEYLQAEGSYINCEIFVDYQETLPFRIFYQKLEDMGYKYYFKWDLIRKGVKIFLKNQGWKNAEFEHLSIRRLSITDLVWFLRERVFSHQRGIPESLYKKAISETFIELQELCLDPSEEVEAPAYSKVSIFTM